MANNGRIRVLLVDDSPEFVQQAEDFFVAEPRIEFAGSAFSVVDALELLRSVDFDLVLVDLSMPHIDGLEATRRIKSRRPAPRVVILTLHDTPDYRAAAAQAGADGFIPKPRLMADLEPLLAELYDC